MSATEMTSTHQGSNGRTLPLQSDVPIVFNDVPNAGVLLTKGSVSGEHSPRTQVCSELLVPSGGRSQLYSTPMLSLNCGLMKVSDGVVTPMTQNLSQNFVSPSSDPDILRLDCSEEELLIGSDDDLKSSEYDLKSSDEERLLRFTDEETSGNEAVEKSVECLRKWEEVRDVKAGSDVEEETPLGTVGLKLAEKLIEDYSEKEVTTHPRDLTNIHDENTVAIDYDKYFLVDDNDDSDTEVRVIGVKESLLKTTLQENDRERRVSKVKGRLPGIVGESHIGEVKGRLEIVVGESDCGLHVSEIREGVPETVGENICMLRINDGKVGVLGITRDENDPKTTPAASCVVDEVPSLAELEDREPLFECQEDIKDLLDSEEDVRLSEDGQYMIFSEHSDDDDDFLTEGESIRPEEDDDDLEIIFVNEISRVKADLSLNCHPVSKKHPDILINGNELSDCELQQTESVTEATAVTIQALPQSACDEVSQEVIGGTEPKEGITDELLRVDDVSEEIQLLADKDKKPVTDAEMDDHCEESSLAEISDKRHDESLTVEEEVVLDVERFAQHDVLSCSGNESAQLVGDNQALEHDHLLQVGEIDVSAQPSDCGLPPQHNGVDMPAQPDNQFNDRVEVPAKSPPLPRTPLPRTQSRLPKTPLFSTPPLRPIPPLLPTPPQRIKVNMYAHRDENPNDTWLSHDASYQYHFTEGGNYPLSQDCPTMTDRWENPESTHFFDEGYGGEQQTDYGFNEASENTWDPNEDSWNNQNAWNNYNNRPIEWDYEHPSDQWNHPQSGQPDWQHPQYQCEPPVVLRSNACFGNASDQVASTHFSEDVPINSEQEFLVNDYSSKYNNFNEDEILDNNDPRWDVLRNQTTDAERFASLRERWGNPTIPDPRKNLTTHNFRRRNRARRPQSTDSSSPIFTTGRKRRASSTMTSDRPGKRLCTILDDKFADVDRDADRKIGILNKERYSAINRVELEKETEISDLVKAYGRSFIHDSYFYDIEHSTSRKRNEISMYFDRKIEEVCREKMAEREELKSAIEEMEAFYKFYGNDGNVILTEDEVEIFVQQEHMFAIYDKFYSG